MSVQQHAYETVLVISLKNGDDARAAVMEKVRALIEQNGTLDDVDEWGKRRLAYKINDEAEGFYVLFHYQAGSEFPAELDRILNITDGVLRFLTVRKVGEK